jgi:vitamin B12 transporter
MKALTILISVCCFGVGAAAQDASPTPSPNIREEVTVKISVGSEQTVEKVSKTVDVIDGQQMRDRADFSLAETLRTIPGFRVQQLGGFGRTANIKTRGLRNQDTAVLIDGIRFRDPTAITGDASPFISDFTLTSVERIEVLRGSGSSLYGTNAIGGVLDFQTPTAKSGTHGQIGGAFGGLGLGRFRGNISHGASGGKFGINAGLSRTVYLKGIDGQDDAHNTNFQTRIDANPFAKTNISGRIFFSDANVRLNVSPDTLGTLPPSTGTIIDAIPNLNFVPDTNDPDAFQKSRFFSGQFSATQIISDRLILSGHYQGLTTRRNNIDGPLGPGFQSAFTSGFDGSIHTANAHLTWTPTARNTLTSGYEFEQEHFRNDNSSGADASFASAGQRSHTLYVQDLVSLLDGNLQLAGGFRVQSFDLGRPRFSATAPPVLTQVPASVPAARTFDGAVSYFFRSTGTKLRAHVGNGYRVPSLYERFGSYFFFGSFFPLGNPGLKPEHSIGADGGLEQYFAKERVKASATYFYTRIKDEITYLPTNDLNASAYYNFDRHFSRGAEASVDIRATSSTNIFTSYTFTNSDVRNFRRTSPASLASADRKAYGIPNHQFTLVATQRFGRAWVNFDLLATSNYLAPIFSNSTFNTYIYRFKGNRKGDLTAGYTFGFKKESRTLRVYGTVENVFDQEYYENGFRTAKANARVGATFGF